MKFKINKQISNTSKGPAQQTSQHLGSVSGGFSASGRASIISFGIAASITTGNSIGGTKKRFIRRFPAQDHTHPFQTADWGIQNRSFGTGRIDAGPSCATPARWMD